MEHAQWTVANSGVTEGLKSVIWSGRQYVVVGYNGVILTSGDGINWIPRSSGVTPNVYGETPTLFSVAWTGEMFIVVGDDGLVLSSPDGISWESSFAGEYEGACPNLYSVAWTGTQLVAVGKIGTVMTSLRVLTS